MEKIGVLFDLDGTLWDVCDKALESTNEVAEKHGVKKVTIETVRSGMGLQTEDNARLYFPDIPLEEALKIKQEIIPHHIEKLKKYGGKVYNDVERTLEILSEKYELFIVSNTGYLEYIEAFLISSGTQKYFKDYSAASKLKISKGKAIKKVMEEYQIKKAVYIGDTKLDKEASEEANIPFIHARYGFGGDLGAQYVINQINELPELLKKFYK